MTNLTQLLRARADRDAARQSFNALRTQVRSDLEARGVGTRIADRASGVATDVFVEAIELADSHRGVLGGTIAALMLWFLRNPIIAAVRQMAGLGDADKKDDDDA